MLRGSGQAGVVTWRCRREEEEEEAAVAARGGLTVPSAQWAGAAGSTCRVPNPWELGELASPLRGGWVMARGAVTGGAAPGGLHAMAC